MLTAYRKTEWFTLHFEIAHGQPLLWFAGAARDNVVGWRPSVPLGVSEHHVHCASVDLTKLIVNFSGDTIVFADGYGGWVDSEVLGSMPLHAWHLAEVFLGHLLSIDEATVFVASLLNLLSGHHIWVERLVRYVIITSIDNVG